MVHLIKNIVFDFGGVILNIHHARVERAFEQQGVRNFKTLFNQASQAHLFQDFEKGQLTPKMFRDELRKLTGLQINDKKIDEAWNTILGDYPIHRIELLKNLAKNYRLFLLSNTNVIHYQFYQDRFREQFGFEFNSLFEECYWSFKIGKRKPDADPFIHIFDHRKISAANTLFIDDSLQNIEASSKLDIPSFWLTNGEDITTLFNGGLLRKDIKFYTPNK